VNISADSDGTFLCSSSVSSSARLSSKTGRKDIRQAGRWTRPGGPLLPFRTVSGHRLRTAACRPSSSRSSRRGWGLLGGQRAPSWGVLALRQHLPCWCPLCMKPGGCDKVVRAVVNARPGASAGPVSADARMGVDVCGTCIRGRRRAGQDLGRGGSRGGGGSIDVQTHNKTGDAIDAMSMMSCTPVLSNCNCSPRS
jgi:hypothetical protein